MTSFWGDAAIQPAIWRPARRGEVRGATPCYWDDVKVGEALPRMLKGPMTVTGFIAYAQGWGGLYIRADSRSARPAPTTTAPSAAPGSPTT